MTNAPKHAVNEAVEFTCRYRQRAGVIIDVYDAGNCWAYEIVDYYGTKWRISENSITG